MDEKLIAFLGRVSTDIQGSDVEFEFEIPAAELEGLSEEAREDVIYRYAKEVAFEHIEISSEQVQ